MGSMKPDLMRYLQQGRDVLLWKLDGLGEYDIRRPMVPTGTNLLGLVKHLATGEAAYLGLVFGRPFPEQILWERDFGPNEDMYATAEESREAVIDFYKRTWAHADATVDELDLDAVGEVPWWPEDRRHPTLHRVLVHVIAETDRHAGHADILRELIDGQVGFRPEVENMDDRADWKEQWAMLEEIAKNA